MSKGNYRRELARIKDADRGTSWKKRAKRHVVDELEAEFVYSQGSRKVVGVKLGSGRVLCTKKRFKSVEAAERRIAEIREQTGDHKKPCRAYACQHCGHFHLTSWPGIDERPEY